MVPLPTQILVRNWGIIFLDFLLFHPIQFITKSHQFYLPYTSHIHPLYFIPILPFSLSRVTAMPQSFNLFLYFKFYSLLTHYSTCSQVIFLKYKSDQRCCSSTLKIFTGFQCSSVSSRIQTCGALSGPGRWAGPNPWEDQPLGNKVVPTRLTIHHSQPLTHCSRGRWLCFWFSLLEFKTHLTLRLRSYRRVIVPKFLQCIYIHFKRGTS